MRHSVIVENRAGADGMIGSEFVVRAPPDGYTLAFVSSAYTTAAALHNFPYDAVEDITALIMVGEASSIAAVHPSVPVKTIKELVSYAKANPGKLNYGSGGTGGFSHLIVELFELLAGTRMTHIPYKVVNREVAQVLRTPEMKERLSVAGVDPTGGPPAEFREALRSDIERWRKVVKAAQIKVSQYCCTRPLASSEL
jgi:tripartite-type tricarboxylate transporter receptor subunit TctC